MAAKKIPRREFVRRTMAGAASAAALSTAAPPSVAPASDAHARPADVRQPNLLFILADDLGWGDLSCYGRPDYRTPNLDRLASEGVRLTHAYSASPVCTPTRCAFATGRYPARTPVGLEEPLAWKKQLVERKRDVGLAPEHPTVASLLKAVGYRTALVGKWHLGYLPKYSPVKSGYDEFYGIMSGGATFFSHKDANDEPDFFEGEVAVEHTGYMTELLTERAVSYLSRRDDARPFYLSLHYNAPHWPWEGPNDAAGASRPRLGYGGMTAGGSLKTYAEMMRSLDEGVGRVMRALRERGLERDTLVVFTSDNGGERFSYNWPFRGAKFELYEGGIRVPAIVRWPGVVPAAKTSAQVAVTMDWTATLVAAGGARPAPTHPFDGVDLLPVLSGARAPFERTLFWRHAGTAAALAGVWKYLRLDEKTERLFDLSADEREQADFASSRPELLAALRDKYRAWESQMLKLGDK
ncbi:MAG TPA: sulfatase-like hydrolase/transferase [Pyrinomonadaceae bacterium]|nr:sulfatase-like hydrolase/transferase [Pyrinomonadaceae bacterium]